MAKYRILEENGVFYPQEKRFWLCGWKYIDNLNPAFTWSTNRNYHSRCGYKIDAEKSIDKRIQYLLPPKQIIHEYNPQNNDKVSDN
jgi:hypothetical protein